MPTSSYTMPPYGSPGLQLLGWCLEAVQEGQAWLGAQRPARAWAGVQEMLSDVEGTGTGGTISGSNVGYNKGKRIAKELVASLSNFRHVGEFNPVWSKDPRTSDIANTLTKLDANWYLKTRARAPFRGGLQYAVGHGTGYWYQTWDSHFWGRGRGDIRLSFVAPQDVTFIQLPASHDMQLAYGVLIRMEMPINLAKAIHAPLNPGFAAGLTPDRDQPGWIVKGLQKLQQFVAPALRVAGRMGQSNQASFPTVDIYHLYTLDGSTNLGPVPVPMGTYGTNWSYTVPALGDPIPLDTINPATKQRFTRAATAEDTLMFPLRRFTIFSRTGICYDGSSPYWHGKVPLTRIRYNDWPWEALGATLVGETKTMQDGIIAIMRAVENSIAARLNPPAVYDDGIVSRSWANNFNPSLAGVRAAAPLTQGVPIQFPVPVQHYDVPSWIPEWVRGQEDRMDYMASTRDIVAIAKAQQIPGADALEKMLEMAGPIVQDMVSALEEPLWQMGQMRKDLYFQFYTRARMITIVGPNGVPGEDIQFSPEQLRGMNPPGESPEAETKRVRGYLDDFEYSIAQSGLNEINRMTQQLFYLQLMKLGFPISWWSFAKLARIPNFGPEPEGTNNEIERWVAQQRLQAELQADIAASMQPTILGPDGQPVSSGGGAQSTGGGPGKGSEGPGGENRGRPQSFQKPPRIESKDGGTRSTVTTA
jgi:hypothetical protein